MGKTTQADATHEAGPPGYLVSKFNAVRHGVLSRYTVLPWESAEDYGDLLQALVAEHQPVGTT